MNKIAYSKNLTRLISEALPKIICDDIKTTISDIIFESEFQSPYFLKNDIREKLEKTCIIKYSKRDLEKYIKGWKYEKEFLNISENFSLTIIECDTEDIEKILKCSNIYVQGEMCEFIIDNNFLNEYIWIKKNAFNKKDESFLITLNHELGHVWTSILNYSNENFGKGITSFNNKSFQSVSNFNQFQMDVLISMYNRNLHLLKSDYDYILKNKQVTNNYEDNWELTTHTDEIIEILINDYLKYHIKEDSDVYLCNLFDIFENKHNVNFTNLTLLKTYKNDEVYENLKNLTFIKNAIRRLFLIFAFGNKKQIEYFKNLCFEEFKNEQK